MVKKARNSKKNDDESEDEEFEDEGPDEDFEEVMRKKDTKNQLQKKAIVMLSGPIGPNHLGLCHELLRYHFDETFNDTITLLINSPGGMCEIGWAIVDTMNFVRCPIQTVCIGFAGSMAADIFVNGDTRVMGEHSTLMVHPHSSITGGSHHKMVATMKGDQIEYNRRLQHYLTNSKYNSKKLVEDIFFKVIGEDLYLTPEECVAHGVADGIAANDKKKKRNKDPAIGAQLLGKTTGASATDRSGKGAKPRAVSAARSKN
jgi:ATP-dependent Clp protease protease subunit